MSLLVDMSMAALDPAYAEAAARRSRGEVPSHRFTTRVLLAVVLVGLGTGVAAAQVRGRADDIRAARQALIDDVQAQTRTTDRLAFEAGVLREEVRRARLLALGVDARGQTAAADVAELELATGAVAVRGPGLVVTLDDAEGAGDVSEDRGGQSGDGRIYDRDIQDVVNALWAAGSEAIAVNGQRLGAQTAIRAAGEAVLVDLRPLSPPYRVEAVGDLDRMEAAFVDSPTARRFHSWTTLYGIGFEVRRAADLRLSATSDPALRLARSGGGS